MRITPKGYVILQNTGESDCDAGCGVSCASKPKTCDTGAIWAFDLATGRQIWKNTSEYFYGPYIRLADDTSIIIHSGGVGAGRFTHFYKINTETGVIEEHRASLVDTEFSEDRNLDLVYDYKTDVVYAVTSDSYLYDVGAHKPLWTLRNGPLHTLIKNNINGGILSFSTLKNVLLAYEYQAGGTMMTHMFNKQNGAELWKKDLSGKQFRANHRLKSFDNVIVFNLFYNSVCSYGCPPNSFVCIHTDEMDRAYSDCQKAEKRKEGYHATEIIGVNATTGEVLWSRVGGVQDEYIDMNYAATDVVRVDWSVPTSGGKYNTAEVFLNPQTGEVITK